MNTQAILEKLSVMYNSDLETLFKAISKANLPSEYNLGEAKALKDFKSTINKNI